MGDGGHGLAAKRAQLEVKVGGDPGARQHAKFGGDGPGKEIIAVIPVGEGGRREGGKSECRPSVAWPHGTRESREARRCRESLGCHKNARWSARQTYNSERAVSSACQVGIEPTSEFVSKFLKSGRRRGRLMS